MTTTDAERSQNGHDRPSSPRLVQLGFAATVLLAIGYAPVAINYMWRYFAPGVPQLQASVTSAIDGHSYAVGYGSVDWLRASAYQENKWVMLVHTTLGGISLLLAVIQFLPATRRHSRFHRWCGRLFMLCLSVSMATAMAFLVLAGYGHFAYAPALWLQLWVLGLSCLGSGWTAVAMARRGNIGAHQGFVFLCFAFLMTAPGLRALWVGLHFVFPRLLLVNNLVGASIAETVLAPTLGVMAFIATRPNINVPVPRRARLDGPIDDLLVIAIVVALTAAHWRTTSTGAGRSDLIWCYLVPTVLAIVTCLIAEARSRNLGFQDTAHRWRTLYRGLIASVLATNATWVCGSWVVGQTGAYVASTMVTTGIPITIAGLILIREITPSEGHPGTGGGRGPVAASRSWIGRPSAISRT